MRWISLCALTAAFAFAADSQEFEVVSIKPNNALSGSSGVNSDSGRLTATNVSLRSLIVTAYGLKDFQVQGPDWLGSEHFDLAAKFPEALPKDREQYSAALQAMMRSMLSDRFKLAVHREQKTFPVYGLIVAKGGIKFKEVPDSDSHSQHSSNSHYTATCVSMDAFAEYLSRQKDLPADVPVLDMTGLKGFYDLKLDWVPESLADSASGPTLLIALEDQLGLKLDSRKAPIELLVVEHVEKTPSEN